VLDQNDRPEVHGTLLCHEPGLRAGMRFGLVNDVWGIDTNYIAEAVSITAPDPEDGSNEALLFSRISFTDKRRVGRMPGGGRRRDRHPGGDGRGGPRDGGGDPLIPPPPGGGGGGGTEPPEDPEDPPADPLAEYTLDDWTRLVTGTYPVEVDFAQDTTVGTTHTIPIPDGADAGNLLLLAYTTTETDGNALITQLNDLGWVTREVFNGVSSTSGAVLVLFIDPATADELVLAGSVIELTTAGSESITYRIVSVAGGPEDGSGLSDTMVTGNGAPAVSGFTGEHELGYVFGFDAQAITGGPTVGYTQVANLSTGSTGLRVYRTEQTGAFNPADFDVGTGAQHGATVAIRFVTPEWGRIPRGRGVDHDGPWDGNNLYRKTSVGFATVLAAGGVGTIELESDGASVSMMLSTDAEDDAPAEDEPWGPWADGDAALRYKWKVNVLGDVADGQPNLLDWLVLTEDVRIRFRVNLGDASDYTYMDPDEQRGIVVLQGVAGAPSTFVPKTLVADTYYQTRLDFRSTRVRMKLWADGDDEPVAWDIDVEKAVPDLDADDVAQLYVHVEGNDGMIFSFDHSWAQLGSIEGLPFPEGELPRGDGVTVTWTIQPWVGLQPMVYVDGLLTMPLSVDPVAGTFTFDRAPALGAWITLGPYTPA
jgi:hypothetical protein